LLKKFNSVGEEIEERKWTIPRIIFLYHI
jgi:hypothetical protein